MPFVAVLVAILTLGQPSPAAEVMAGFDQRIKAYADLRATLEKDQAAALEETAQPAELVSAELVLAAKIRAARASAKRGDIFTPEVEQQFRRLVTPHLRGIGGKNTKGIIRDEGPGLGALALKVNHAYPKDQPVGTMPPNLLAALPRLPEHIEYRFVDRYLILRDTRANLIIDFMPNALS